MMSPVVIGHVAGPEGGNLPLMLAGAGVIAVAVVLSTFKAKPKLVRWLMAGGLVLVGVGAALSPFGGAAASQANVSIVRPEDGARVPADRPVEIEVTVVGGEIAASPTDQEGGHLHLYVDGELQQMPYSTTAVVDLPRGAHTLRVEYVDNRHVSFDPEIDTTVNVTAR